MVPPIVFPIGYTLIDTFLVVFIKATSVAGRTSYNTITVNAITEFIKLCIAVYIAYGEGSLHTLNQIVHQPGLLVRFLIPNLMYAVNNNLFHYSISALPPAVFVVAINALRTIFTAALQPCVSNQSLTLRQIGACVLLVLSFVCASLPEIIRAAFNGTVKGSILEMLMYLSVVYSVISVTASLAQEKLLKDSKSLMVANIVNYSIGLSFQLMAMFYESYQQPNEDLFRGLNIFWVKLIPCLMALVGLSISFVLRYYDNIVKLICSSVSVLMVNSITCALAGESLLNIYFLVGWLLTLPATYLYHTKACAADGSNTSSLTSNTEVVAPLCEVQEIDADRGKIQVERISKQGRWLAGALFTVAFVFSVTSMTFEMESVKSVDSFRKLEVSESCPVFEVPMSDVRSNLRVVNSYDVKYTKQFSIVDDLTGSIYVSCGGDIAIFGPDTAYTKTQPDANKWRQVNSSIFRAIPDLQATSTKTPIDETYFILPWDYVDETFGINSPFFWLHCSEFPDFNLVVRPPMPKFRPNRPPLPELEKQDVSKYIEHLSVGGDSSPIFDTVLIIYFDALSRIKFHRFFKKTAALLASMSSDSSDMLHESFELERFHSLWLNSEGNYPSFYSGVYTKDTKRFNAKSRDSKTFSNFSDPSMREPWLFDIAEAIGFETVAATTSCQQHCTEDCNQRMDHSSNYEIGGFFRQYMAESGDRLPGAYVYPSAAYCETGYRSELARKGCSTCRQAPILSEYWNGNKLSMSYVFDWWRVWMSSHRSGPQTPTKRFASIVFEETHQQDFIEQYDMEYAQFLSDLLVTGRSKYGTENTAIVLMADHGLHFDSEFKMVTGKVANKQPYGYLILPKSYLANHPIEAANLRHNANKLTSSYDIRATVGYWLTGRDWGHKALKSVVAKKTSTDPSSILYNRIYASRHGENMMTSRIESNRTCEMAGIPSEFCGCNLIPCDGTLKSVVKGSKKEIVRYINSKISEGTPEALPICTPLEESEIIFTPGMDECLASKDSIVINAFVQRQMKLISVTFSLLQGNRLKVQNVNTITPYQKIWRSCAAKFREHDIPNNLREENYQYCHCDKRPDYRSIIAGILNKLD